MRPRKVWLITDTHWFHEKTIEWCNRPRDFTERSIKNCQLLVQPQDTLIHLGDVIFQKHKLKPILDSIQGRKILVKGNHDKETDSWYSRNGFDFVCNSCVVKDVMLSHKPMLIPVGIRLNVHGHFHNSDHHRHEPALSSILESRHRLLALEYVQYRPVDFESFTAG